MPCRGDVASCQGSQKVPRRFRLQMLRVAVSTAFGAGGLLEPGPARGIACDLAPLPQLSGQLPKTERFNQLMASMQIVGAPPGSIERCTENLLGVTASPALQRPALSAPHTHETLKELRRRLVSLGGYRTGATGAFASCARWNHALIPLLCYWRVLEALPSAEKIRHVDK